MVQQWCQQRPLAKASTLAVLRRVQVPLLVPCIRVPCLITPYRPAVCCSALMSCHLPAWNKHGTEPVCSFVSSTPVPVPRVLKPYTHLQAAAGEDVLRGDGVLPVRRRHAGVLGDAAQGLLGDDDAPLRHDHPHRTVVPPQVRGPVNDMCSCFLGPYSSVAALHGLWRSCQLCDCPSRSFTRVGCMILLLHDVCDVLMEAAKMFKYCGQEVLLCSVKQLGAGQNVVWAASYPGHLPSKSCCAHPTASTADLCTLPLWCLSAASTMCHKSMRVVCSWGAPSSSACSC
jgi:hypothetical protein